MSCPISEPLPNDTLERVIGAGNVVNAQGNAVVVPEIELGQIPLKMRLGNVMIDTDDTALHDREIALDGVGMRVATNILANSVVHSLVFEVLMDVAILARVVGHDGGFRVELFPQDGAKIVPGDVGHMERTNAPITLDEREYGLLAGAADFSGALGAVPILLLAADVGFVRFNKLADTTHWRRITVPHGFTDAMRHEPSGLESDAQGPMKLIGANALLAGRDQEDGLQPDMQLHMAGLEDGANLYGEGLAALIALVEAQAGALAFQLSAAIHDAAMRADAALWPNMRLYELVGGFFVVKVRGRKDRHWYLH